MHKSIIYIVDVAVRKNAAVEAAMRSWNVKEDDFSLLRTKKKVPNGGEEIEAALSYIWARLYLGNI